MHECVEGVRGDPRSARHWRWQLPIRTLGPTAVREKEMISGYQGIKGVACEFAQAGPCAWFRCQLFPGQQFSGQQFSGQLFDMTLQPDESLAPRERLRRQRPINRKAPDLVDQDVLAKLEDQHQANLGRQRIGGDRRRHREPRFVGQGLDHRQIDGRTQTAQGDAFAGGHSKNEVFHRTADCAGQRFDCQSIMECAAEAPDAPSGVFPSPAFCSCCARAMTAVPETDALALACSRCDGPVNLDDLAEGLAVRIDGQPVCEVCIETLTPALRMQINRVRALKGLAVVTYRVARPQHPNGHFYTFTGAGLLLLHRRALVHGTEFTTPELPPDHRPAATIGRLAPVTGEDEDEPVLDPPSKRKNLVMMGLAAVGVIAVLGAITVLALSGGQKQKHSQENSAGPDHAVVATPVANGPAVPVMPTLPEPGASVSDHDLPYYRDRFSDENAALLAGLADGAAPEVITALERDVLARGRTNLDRLGKVLRQTGLSRSTLDDVDVFLRKAQVPVRPAFKELIEGLGALTEMAQRKRALLPPDVAVTPDANAVPAVTSPTVPPEEPAKNPPEVVPPVTATVPPPAVPPLFVPDPGTKTPPPLTFNTDPDGKLIPAPAVTGHGKSKITIWSGEPGPKTAAYVDLADSKVRLPSPWPFFPGEPPPRFVPAVKVRGADRQEIYTLQLSFTAEQVSNGGIFLNLHPRLPTRKEVVITRLDAPTVAPQHCTFSDGETWQSFAYRVDGVPSDTVTIQIADAANNDDYPFWLGATAAVADGDPLLAKAELSPSPLMMPNPMIDWRPLVESLKIAARSRKQEAKWFVTKTLDTGSVKIFGTEGVSASKINPALRLRRSIPDIANMVETVDVVDMAAIRRLFERKANPGLFNQKALPATVVLVPNGKEATSSPTDWAKHVLTVNELLRNGTDAKSGNGGFVPVWVIGSVDGAPLTTTAWSMVRTNKSVVLIDLTVQAANGADSAVRARREAYDTLTEGIHTLMYQLRLVQIYQSSR